MGFAVIDIVFGIVILLCIAHCVITGFIKELFSKLALLGGTFAAVLFYGFVAKHLYPHIGIPLVSAIIGFIIVFAVVYVAIRIVEKVVGLAFRGEIGQGLDRALGLFLGLFEGLLISSLILVLITGQRFFNLNALLQDSFFYKLLGPILRASGKALMNLV